MGKIKSAVILAAALSCPFLVCSGSAAGDVLRSAAYLSAGVIVDEAGSEVARGDPAQSVPEKDDPPDLSSKDPEPSSVPENNDPPEYVNAPVTKTAGRIITKNRSEYVDMTDFSAFNKKSGDILRYNYGKFSAECYITLDSGAQVRNCTELANDVLLKAAEELPGLDVSADAAQPSVLIYHTHSSESYLPLSDGYDANYPLRSLEADRSVIAVGDAICEALSKRGISSVHDCTIHDYPQYTGAYYRSEETILKNIREYPSIKLILDIHRDGIANADGSLVAPIAKINGKNAAQFMIISGCDNGDYNIPDYIENYKLACLLQNCAENAFPSLARPVLFDYRNYNQDVSTGALLIEVGSQGNSLEEAVYTGELLGNVIADAVEKLSQ